MSFMFRDRKDTEFAYSRDSIEPESCMSDNLKRLDIRKIQSFLLQTRIRGRMLKVEREALMEYPPSVARDSAIAKCNSLISFIDEVLEVFGDVQ